LQRGDSLSAYQYFQNVYAITPFKTDVNYYFIMLSLCLDKSYAANLTNKWLAVNNNRIYDSRLHYFLGRYYFHKNQTDLTIEAYNKVSIDDLDNKEIGLMKFELAYCYFKKTAWDKAVNLLNNIRQVKNSFYYYDANYYAGFIALEQKNFSLAMECFKIAAQSNAYNKLTPFYISQLYYLLGDVPTAITSCEKALQSGYNYYKADLEQLLGHLLFEKKEYARAMPYLETFVGNKKEVDFQDLYQLSFCYFEAKQWDKATTGFKKLANAEDSLGQNSMYLLATCYLQKEDLLGAKNAFLLCATKSQNLAQKEISLFNYAKLCVALKEYTTAVSSLDKFIESYPNSVYAEEAKSLWITSLTYNNNFVQALEAYQSIEKPTDELLKVYPSILYGRACLYLNDGQAENAYELFEKIANTPYNSKVLTFTRFWLGELAYKLGRISESIVYLERYLQDPQETNEVSVVHAHYTLGYAYLKQNAYQKAMGHFNDALAGTAIAQYEAYQKDAYTRIADCQMMLKNLKVALQSYQHILDLNWDNKDYAALQKSILWGGLGKPNDKITLLKDFNEQYPHSIYANDARIELADTYVSQEDFQNAIAPLSQVLLDKKATSFYPQAYYKLGIVYFNLNKNEMALNTFNDLFRAYPNSSESENSVEFVRNIYVENQTPELFVQFMNEYKKPLSTNEQDSLIFRSAILKYEQKKYTESAIGFSKYLQLFPTGKNLLQATYLSAEIAYTQQQYDSAALLFAKVADLAPNIYAERAALVAARLNYFNFKQYDKAEKYFQILAQIATQQENKLEANRGLLRCQYKLEKWADGAVIANVIVNDKTSANDDLLMANMTLFHNNMIKGDTLQAIAIVSKVIKSAPSTYTAEAHFSLAKIYYEQGKYNLAEKTAFEMIKKQASFEYWVTKAYILLGDIYVGQKDNFNALATYKSVAENANFEDLKQVALDKLKALQVADQSLLK
jgi:tetratricopeptide (TPR) repeat protein